MYGKNHSKTFLSVYRQNIAPRISELDIYHLYLDGLLTVEVEFPDMAECMSFVPPKWFGKDISDDKRYKNTALSLFGKPE